MVMHMPLANGMPPAPNAKVLILEPYANGHHGPYLHWMASGLAERGFDVTIITLPESMAHPSMRALAKPVLNGGGGSLRLVGAAAPMALLSGATGGAVGLAARERAYWTLFRAWYNAYAESVRPDVVYVPYLDYCLYAIGLLGSPFGNCPWVGLAMRPSFHYQEIGVIAPKPSLAIVRKAIFFRLLNNRHLRRLLTLDEPLAEYLKDKCKVAEKVMFFPEPADLRDIPDADAAKKMLGLPQDRKLVIVYGAITKRKGVAELLRALADTDFPLFVDVLLAGKISADVHEVLSETWVQPLLANGRLRLFDRFISGDEEAILFAAADTVWLGYKGHYGASGVLVQAARAGRAVLACDEGIIGWQTKRYRLGMTVSINNPKSVISALNNLINSQSKYPHVAGATSIGTSIAAAQQLLIAALSRAGET